MLIYNLLNSANIIIAEEKGNKLSYIKRIIYNYNTILRFYRIRVNTCTYISVNFVEQERFCPL